MAEVLSDIAGTHKTIEELRQEYTEENGYDNAGDYQKALDKVERQGLEGSGQLYRLEVPENDVLLDWDKPLSEQPKKVKAAIRRIAKELSPEAMADLDGDIRLLIDPENTGAQFYSTLGSLAGIGQLEIGRASCRERV